jgi:hypothetical protein
MRLNEQHKVFIRSVKIPFFILPADDEEFAKVDIREAARE